MSNDSTKEAMLSDAEELAAIDAIIHYKAHQLSPSEAVKWMNELYGTQCAELQKIAKDFKMGMGGERLTTAIRTWIEQAHQQDKARIEELAGLVQELVDALWDGIPTDASAGRNWNNALSKAKQLGFTPSTQ